jgi:hypothetical protein
VRYYCLLLIRIDIANEHPVLTVVNTVQCNEREDFGRLFDKLRDRQAEGIVLRDPNAWYFKQDSFFTKSVRGSYFIINFLSPLKRAYLCLLDRVNINGKTLV